jgi:hypothetical protein
MQFTIYKGAFGEEEKTQNNNKNNKPKTKTNQIKST